MTKSSNKGFTLIELLVVIAIIGLLSTLAVVALNSARQKSRDSKRVADIKQIQTALELYFADANGYPTAATAVELGTGSQKALCTGGWKAACAMGDTTYMGLVPAKPTPNDGTCNSTSTLPSNLYQYTSAAGTTYTITFCIGGAVGDLTAGAHTASPNGIQ
ncbi:MAG TPA: prepilin-type N-terminal cleavage/methylation domain-containing protein [Candidatus Binatia bacterium]|jgi:general secretion pathway protein G|nr:prepilin-type N-terminal cleavage/methylation domain-containing protein [Candidatus Binatia bacterium]